MFKNPPSCIANPSRPWLSILIPAYQVAPWLPACLDSVLTQSVPGLEVLVLDDASPDDSRAIAQEYAGRHPELVRTLAHDHNRGPGAARNSLLAAANGEYVWFIDADDVLLPGAIADLAGIIAREKPDLVLCDFAILREHPRLRHRLRRRERHTSAFCGPTRGINDQAQLAKGLLAGGQLHPWSKIARHTLWQQAPFPEGRYFEDISIIPALIQASRHWVHAPRPWVHYRKREGSILASSSPVKIRDLLCALRELHKSLAIASMAPARMALDTFVMRHLASTARELHRLSEQLEPTVLKPLWTLYSEVFADCLPDGGVAILSAWRRQGAWVRAWRIERRLAYAQKALVHYLG